MNLRATSFSLLSTLVGNTQTKLTLRQYSLQCYLHCRLIYSIVLNIFISSVCQNQTRPCRQFYNMPRLPRFRERKCALSHSEHKQNRRFYNMSGLMFRLNTSEGGRGREGSRTPVQTDYFIHTVHSCKCSDDQSEHSI